MPSTIPTAKATPSLSRRLDGRETRIAFNATTGQNYELRVTIHLPAAAKDDWVRYSCLMGSVPTYHSCGETGHLKIAWTIRDQTDGAWHDWTVNAKPEFENVGGIGEGRIGWFTPVRGHAYIILVRAEADVPAIRQSPSVVDVFFGEEATQDRMAFGNLIALFYLAVGIPLALVGALLILACWPQRTAADMAAKP